tara:strand:- start:55 stop:507 length:453 start_codon:yes stop_codon:yes gene_type:complete
MNKNSDLKIKIDHEIDPNEAYDLFLIYQDERHTDGDMGLMSFEEFYLMFFDKKPFAKRLGFYLNNTLIAMILYDLLEDGASAVYSVFSPDYSKRSLGKYVVYYLVNELKHGGLTNLYLGYWIKNSPTMDYKGHFNALEILDYQQGWIAKD